MPTHSPAFDENLTRYKQQIPALFCFNALLIATNGTDSRVGSLTADWEVLAHGHLLRRASRTSTQCVEHRRVSLEVMIRGTCDKLRLLDLVAYFTLFSEHKAGLVKIIGQNHQFLGVNNAIASVLAARHFLVERVTTISSGSARGSRGSKLSGRPLRLS